MLINWNYSNKGLLKFALPKIDHYGGFSPYKRSNTSSAQLKNLTQPVNTLHPLQLKVLTGISPNRVESALHRYFWEKVVRFASTFPTYLWAAPRKQKIPATFTSPPNTVTRKQHGITFSCLTRVNGRHFPGRKRSLVFTSTQTFSSFSMLLAWNWPMPAWPSQFLRWNLH